MPERSFDPVIIGCCGANLASLGFALARLGIDAPVSNEPARIGRASHVILPGVGAARSAMQRLRAAGLDVLVPELTQPVLGICLGMQLLMTSSEEEETACLGILPGRVARLPANPARPVPHMGWNRVEILCPSALLDGLEDLDFAYFVHSYAAPIAEYTQGASDYGVEFSAVVEHENFFGTQFHPERSSKFGAQLLRNFLSL